MIKILALLLFTSVCVIINAQETASNEKPFFGQTFDEIVVSSDLNVRRKSKEKSSGQKIIKRAVSNNWSTRKTDSNCVQTRFRRWKPYNAGKQGETWHCNNAKEVSGSGRRGILAEISETVKILQSEDTARSSTPSSVITLLSMIF